MHICTYMHTLVAFRLIVSAASYLPYSTPLRNRLGAAFGYVCRLRREILISQNWLKG